MAQQVNIMWVLGVVRKLRLLSLHVTSFAVYQARERQMMLVTILSLNDDRLELHRQMLHTTYHTVLHTL